MKYNLLIVVSAEEEISGKKGIFSLLPILPKIEFAIIGEPTEMNMAIASKTRKRHAPLALKVSQTMSYWLFRL